MIVVFKLVFSFQLLLEYLKYFFYSSLASTLKFPKVFLHVDRGEYREVTTRIH